jgi:hypothetical protein
LDAPSRVAKGEAMNSNDRWKPISTAPTLDRVYVAGWQKRQGNTRGYWWVHEDLTDEKGWPMSYPGALYWQPIPERPTFAGPDGEMP